MIDPILRGGTVRAGVAIRVVGRHVLGLTLGGAQQFRVERQRRHRREGGKVGGNLVRVRPVLANHDLTIGRPPQPSGKPLTLTHRVHAGTVELL